MADAANDSTTARATAFPASADGFSNTSRDRSRADAPKMGNRTSADGKTGQHSGSMSGIIMPASQPIRSSLIYATDPHRTTYGGGAVGSADAAAASVAAVERRPAVEAAKIDPRALSRQRSQHRDLLCIVFPKEIAALIMSYSGGQLVLFGNTYLKRTRNSVLNSWTVNLYDPDSVPVLIDVSASTKPGADSSVPAGPAERPPFETVNPLKSSGGGVASTNGVVLSGYSIVAFGDRLYCIGGDICFQLSFPFVRNDFSRAVFSCPLDLSVHSANARNEFRWDLHPGSGMKTCRSSFACAAWYDQPLPTHQLSQKVGVAALVPTLVDPASDAKAATAAVSATRLAPRLYVFGGLTCRIDGGGLAPGSVLTADVEYMTVNKKIDGSLEHVWTPDVEMPELNGRLSACEWPGYGMFVGGNTQYDTGTASDLFAHGSPPAKMPGVVLDVRRRTWNVKIAKPAFTKEWGLPYHVVYFRGLMWAVTWSGRTETLAYPNEPNWTPRAGSFAVPNTTTADGKGFHPRYCCVTAFDDRLLAFVDFDVEKYDITGPPNVERNRELGSSGGRVYEFQTDASVNGDTGWFVLHDRVPPRYVSATLPVAI